MKALLNESVETTNLSVESIEFLPQQETNQILFIKFRETFGLIKIEFSQFFNNENLNCLYFTSNLLKNNQPKQLFQFLLNCEKNANFFQCLILLLNYLIKNEIEDLLQDIIINYSIYLTNKENNIYSNQFEAIIRRTFNLFLLKKKFKISFQISNIYSSNDKKMFEDLYFYSKEHHNLSTSYLSFLKSNKLFQSEVQNLNLLLEKSELNKIEPKYVEKYNNELNSTFLKRDSKNSDDNESICSSVSLDEITIDILNDNLEKPIEQVKEENTRIEKIKKIFSSWK